MEPESREAGVGRARAAQGAVHAGGRDHVQVRLLLRLIVIAGFVLSAPHLPGVIVAWVGAAEALIDPVRRLDFRDVLEWVGPVRQALDALAGLVPGAVALFVASRFRRVERALCRSA